ncbi:MAG: hypothetical protein LBD44_01855 [Spirochaetaceae bacterium]|jgi:hypothetical protein|nr:hypothetical protein [Spirochaetaceae bacterium]
MELDKIIEHNWKLYEANEHLTDKLIETREKTDACADKWLVTLAAGSFGLSFAFIDTLVPLKSVVDKPLLIAAWTCFALELAGFVLSFLRYTLMVEKLDQNFPLKYEGKNPVYKHRSIYFDPNRVLMYVVLLIFFGGLICLLAFVARNILV